MSVRRGHDDRPQGAAVPLLQLPRNLGRHSGLAWFNDVPPVRFISLSGLPGEFLSDLVVDS